MAKSSILLSVRICALAAALFAVVFSGFADAQERGTRIAISPLVFELVGEQGELLEHFVRVINPSSEVSLQVLMQIETILPSGEEGAIVPAVLEEVESRALAKWISVDEESFSLDPGEERVVRFQIAIPENAEPGGHYASVIAGSRGIIGPAGAGVGILPRVGSIILLTVPGEVHEELAIASFGADSRYYEYGPVKFAARFQNTGTLHARPSAILTITNMIGRKVAEIPLEQRNVLPGAVRRFETQWDKRWLWGGRYTATLSGTYGRSNLQMSPMVTTFWAFPWRAGIVALLVFLFMFFTRRRWIVAVRILARGEKGLTNANVKAQIPNDKLNPKPK